MHSDALGIVRSEALLTDRAAHFVCYPGGGSRDRIITVRESEHATATSLLRLCQAFPSKRKEDLQEVCQKARAELRRGVAEAAVIAAALKDFESRLPPAAALAAVTAVLARRPGDTNFFTSADVPASAKTEAHYLAGLRWRLQTRVGLRHRRCPRPGHPSSG